MKAELIDYLGSDLTVVNAARVSFDKESEWHFIETDAKNQLKAQDVKLINYLAKHNHFTPFTHPQITLRETVPLFVARQRFKHVVGFSYNEVSRRYISSDPDIFITEVFRNKPDNAKQGSGFPHVNSDKWKHDYIKTSEYCLLLYKQMIEDGVCPEQARMVLPQSMYTSYYVTGSLAAFARLYQLRTDSHAQLEIQQLAKQIGDIIAPLYPVSWQALTTKNY